MKKIYTKNLLLTIFIVLGIASAFAQQVPNPSFEDWSGEKYDGQIQPKDWYASNVTQVGFNFNFAHQEGGHSGSYSMMVQDTEVGAMGITETSPGYFSLGRPWTYLPSITEINKATAGTHGGINFTYRPDSMSVWIKRTGSNTDKEDFYLLYYAWSGTAKGSKYKGKNGNCTSYSLTNEESDIRLALNNNECGTDQKANQIAEGMWRERKTYGEWTNIRVPIYYFNNDVPSMMNIIFSASNYPNFRANSGLYVGNSLYVDDVELIYSSKIQKLYIDGKEWKGFDSNSSEEQIYSLGRTTTNIPDIKAYRGAGTLTNASGKSASFSGRELQGNEISITQGTIDGAPTIITVKAEDGSSTTTYKIKFVREASSNTKLANIYIDGKALASFQPSLYNYNVELPYGTTTVPQITVEQQEEEQSVAITQPTSITDNATIVVTAADKKSTATYTIQFKVAQLADNSLKDIKVNGTSIAGFSPNQTLYRVSLPTSTDKIPVVEAVSAYAPGEQTITHTAPTSVANLDGSQHSISVTTPGNPTPRTYKLTYKLEASSYSLLSELQMGENWITNFTPNQFTYYVNLPVGTIELPAITYKKGESTQTVTVQEGGLNGVTKVIVVAGNGKDQSEYKIVVSTAKSEISSLDMIYIGGEPLTDFNPAKTSYSYTLPIGTTELPAITVDKGDEYQKVNITTGGINGTTRIAVTAENGNTTVYQISFSVFKATNATLKMIYLDGKPLQGFDPSVLEYNCPLPQGTTLLPVITYDQADEYQTVTVRSGGVNGDYRITVRPQSGASQTYILHFSVATSDNASLDMIYLNGVALEGFHSDTLHYIDTLPMGVYTIPTVTYTKGHEAQKVLSICSQNTQTIKVTAESGKVQTYTIQFVIQRSNSAFLKMIYLDGVAINGFDKNTFEYTISLTTATCPRITVDKEDGQQVTITAPYSTGQAKIVVTPEGGGANTYVINFVNVTNNTALLKNIYMDGNAITGFHPEVFEYDVVTSNAHPAITYNAEATQKVTLFRNKNIITLYVVSGTDKAQYTLTLDAQANTDCTLRSITIDGTTLVDFDANKHTYTIALGNNAIPVIDYEKQYEEQTIYAGMIDADTYSILVRAQSGDTARYTIHMQQEISTDANLTDLSIDGLVIDFQPTTYLYTLDLPEGNVLPDIHVVSKEGQDIALHVVSNTEQEVVVTAPSGASKTYRILYNRNKSSNAYLSDILINGISIKNFESTVFHYADTLAWRTKATPCVQPIGMHDHQIITTYHSAVNGKTIINVMAPDSVTTQEYTIDFHVTKSSNLALEYILLDHESLEIDYKEDITDYTISVPYGENAAPIVLYKAQEPEQTIEYISRPLGQTSQIIVTAENGDQRTYNLHFNKSYASANNLLAKLNILETGESLDVTSMNHTIVLPYSTRSMTVTYTKAFTEQTVWVQPGGINAPTIITVKSNRPGEDDIVYTITPQIIEQDPAILTDLSINGTTIADFAPNRFSYIANVTNVPIVTYTTNPNVTVNIVTQTNKHWQAKVTYKGRTNTYDIWYYYADEQVPNTEFTEWTNCQTLTSAVKPTGWNTIADVLGKHSGFGSFTPDGLVAKSGNDAVYLKTAYSTPGGGNIPGFITLGTVSGRWGVAGTSSFGISGGISFHNTPDLITIKYYNSKVTDNSLIQYTLTGQDGTKTLEWRDSETASDYKEVTYDLTEANTTAGAPTLLNITVCSYNTTDGTTGSLSTAAEMYVDYLRFAYNSALANIYVNGEMASKDGNNFTYTLTDSEYTLLPTLSFVGEVADQAQKIVWSDETKDANVATRTATITNYAENGSSTEYTLTVKRPLDTRNTLSDLQVGGNTISAFDPNKTEYVYTLSSTQNLPDLHPMADGSMQTITTQYADSTMTIVVTPESGESTTYIVRFITDLSSDVELNNISIEGASIVFDPAQKEYAIAADKMPAISFVKKMDGQTVDMQNGVLTVTAENGNKGTYTISLNKPVVVTEGQLATIEIDGVELQGFNSDVYDYNHKKPNVATFKRIADSDSVIYVQTPLYMEWQVYGTEQHTYRITYPNEFSSNTEMDSILINGKLIDGFNKQIYEYTYKTDESVFIQAFANDQANYMLCEQSVQDDTAIYTYTVTAEDGTVGTPYSVTILPNLSNSTYLNGIYVDGQLIDGFRKDSLLYTITIPAGTYKTVEPTIPSITYQLGASRQQVSIEYGELGEATTLMVVSEDGNHHGAYELLIEAEPSHCATLNGIAVNGEAIDKFESERHHYSVKCNEDDVVITWASNDHYQTVKESSNGNTHVLQVTAQDGVNISEYTIEVYKEAASSDVTLANILLDGQTFDQFFPALNDDLHFSSMQQRYNINLPSGTQYLPEVNALLNAEGQNVEIKINEWTIEIHVTAPDAVSKNIYTLRFFAPKSTNSQLKMIYLDGEPLQTFDPSIYKYDILLPIGQDKMPDVYAEAQEPMQTIVDSITGALQHTIYVTAEDGSMNLYYLSFLFNPSNADTLAAIYGDGELIQGFHANTFYYAYTLPVGTDHIPALTWDAADEWQNITATKAVDTPTKQITQIQVVAGSGKKNMYTVEYVIAQSTIDTLEMIYVQGDALKEFNPYTNDYHIYLAPGDTVLPSVSWKEGDTYQQVTPTLAPMTYNKVQIGWKQHLEILAQDGHSRVYTLYFYFTKALSKNTDLNNIYLNGEPLANFNPSQYTYREDVAEGQSMPRIFVEKADAMQTVSINTSNGNAVITVTAEDTVYTSTYTIYFNYLKSSYAYLEGIYQDNALIDGFRPEVFEYHIVLPYGTTQMPTFTYELGKEGQIVDVETIESGNNKTTYVFTVTAPDEETATAYTIVVEIARNNNSRLQKLLVKGTEIDNFHADTINYLLTYPIGSDASVYASKEDIIATPEDSNATVTIEQNGTDIIILVQAHDGISTSIYTIEQVILQSSNTRLAAIYIDDAMIRDFDPEVLDYEYYVRDAQPTILAIAEDSSATIEYGIYAVDAPYYIYVTAEDGSEDIYTIFFKQTTIQTSTAPAATEVLMKPVAGTRDITFATLRKNVSVAVYNADGQRLFYEDVPESSQNDVYMITNVYGQNQLVDVYNTTTTFTLPEDNTIYFYVFYENGKRKIASGKFFFTR